MGWPSIMCWNGRRREETDRKPLYKHIAPDLKIQRKYMKNKTYLCYSDPGHGWMKVTRAELVTLGIANQITSCSYQREDCVYLEEDCDVALFFTTFKAKFGHKPKTKLTWGNRQSRIRNYQPYSPT